MDPEDITPEDSVVPVYLQATEPVEDTLDLGAVIAAQAVLRASAVQKLIKRQALTQAEAELLVGL